jgi:hypothetical protein
VLIAVLSGTPIVHTVCALACGPDTVVEVAVTAHEGHCAQPEPPAAPENTFAAAGDCGGCELLDESPRVAFRVASPVALQPLPAFSPADLPRAGSHGSAMSERSASPPFPALFPLRI